MCYADVVLVMRQITTHEDRCHEQSGTMAQLAPGAVF
jgi:hypothetical protein